MTAKVCAQCGTDIHVSQEEHAAMIERAVAHGWSGQEGNVVCTRCYIRLMDAAHSEPDAELRARSALVGLPHVMPFRGNLPNRGYVLALCCDEELTTLEVEPHVPELLPHPVPFKLHLAGGCRQYENRRHYLILSSQCPGCGKEPPKGPG